MTPFTRIAPLMREFGINYTVNSEVPLDSESPASLSFSRASCRSCASPASFAPSTARRA